MNKKEYWIIENIPNEGVDILHSDFVDNYIKEFSPPFIEVNFGAYKCPQLSRLLSCMYKKNILERGTISLGCCWQPGFPKWVYVYTLEKSYKSIKTHLLETK